MKITEGFNHSLMNFSNKFCKYWLPFLRFKEEKSSMFGNFRHGNILSNRMLNLNVVVGDAANIILDSIFIFILRMGVGGAAIAHVISQ